MSRPWLPLRTSAAQRSNTMNTTITVPDINAIREHLRLLAPQIKIVAIRVQNHIHVETIQYGHTYTGHPSRQEKERGGILQGRAHCQLASALNNLCKQIATIRPGVEQKALLAQVDAAHIYVCNLE